MIAGLPNAIRQRASLRIPGCAARCRILHTSREKTIRNGRHLEALERLFICGLKVRFLRGSLLTESTIKHLRPVEAAIADRNRTRPTVRALTKPSGRFTIST
jgi:hypothetical protein